MDNGQVVRLDTSTKVLYSLFNFFAPISFTALAMCSLELFNITATLLSLLSIIVGLFCLILNLTKYNRFLCISDKTISICKGNINNPKVIQMIKTENIATTDLNRNLTIRYENKKIKLLHTSFSILGVICYIGPLVAIPILKNINTAFHSLFKLHQTLPALFETAPKKPSKVNDIIVNIAAWGFVLFVSAIGCLGILLIPFYPFL